MSVRRRVVWPFVLMIGFAAGALTDWWLTPRSPAPTGDVNLDTGATAGESGLPVAERSLGTSGGGVPSLPGVAEAPSVVRELLLKSLIVPVEQTG